MVERKGVRSVVTIGKTKRGTKYRAHGNKVLTEQDIAALEVIFDAAKEQMREAADKLTTPHTAEKERE